MKKIISILYIGILLFIANACSSTNNASSADTTKLLNGKEFTFMAERAIPTNMDVINVMNSMQTKMASQMLNLDYGYSLKITRTEVVAELPYFGRMFNANYDTSKNSYRFTSKDFTIDESKSKKGSAVYLITAKDQQGIKRMNLEVYPNGKAYLYIDSNDRQPISYDGYVKENAVAK